MIETVTTEFRDEYEAELAHWIRRRFRWYTGITVGWLGVTTLFAGVMILLGILRNAMDDGTLSSVMISLYATAVAGLMYAAAFFWARRSRRVTEQKIRRAASGLLIVYGFIGIASGIIGAEVRRRLSPGFATAVGDFSEVQTVLSSAVGVGFIHFIACLFLPWRPKECIRPLIPLLIGIAGVAIWYLWGHWVAMGVMIVLSPLIGAPGLLVCLWRHSRFRQKFHLRMLKGRYGEIKRDLMDARRIHESLFPAPVTAGPVRLDYRYEPMRQIGGDFLFTHTVERNDGRGPVFNVAIIDVTGHGIGAALTVNRLYGEIAREFGVKPDTTPRELLTGLNAYLHFSLATHSVYATAFCVQIDPHANTLTWASAGHPPAFVRAIDNTVHPLDPTTLVLGACHGDDFTAVEESMRFVPGDVLIAYTDGATEARNAAGTMLRIDGLLRIVANVRPDADGGFASAVLNEIDRHRHGPCDDDTLIVEVYRPVEV